MKRWAIIALAASALALLLLSLLAPLRAAQADTYRELKECLRHDINRTKRFSWARFLSVADCYAAWGDQKLSINIQIGSASSGYDTRFPLAPYLMVEGLSSVTAAVTVLSGDPLNSIDLLLVNDAYNPPDPNFGVLVGSDSNGADGWSITFNPDVGGADQWVGYLVAEAHFAGHDPEADGDAAAIYITRDEDAPQGRIGGIAEVPDIAGTAGDQAAALDEASGWSSANYAALAVGVAALVLALGAGGWYVRRRWIR